MFKKLMFLQTAATSWTTTWNSFLVWYGHSSCITRSPCPYGTKTSQPRRTPPPSSVCSRGCRTSCPTFPSTTSPPTGTMVERLERLLTPSRLVCKAHLRWIYSHHLNDVCVFFRPVSGLGWLEPERQSEERYWSDGLCWAVAWCASGILNRFIL